MSGARPIAGLASPPRRSRLGSAVPIGRALRIALLSRRLCAPTRLELFIAGAMIPRQHPVNGGHSPAAPSRLERARTRRLAARCSSPASRVTALASACPWPVQRVLRLSCDFGPMRQRRAFAVWPAAACFDPRAVSARPRRGRAPARPLHLLRRHRHRLIASRCLPTLPSAAVALLQGAGVPRARPALALAIALAARLPVALPPCYRPVRRGGPTPLSPFAPALRVSFSGAATSVH